MNEDNGNSFFSLFLILKTHTKETNKQIKNKSSTEVLLFKPQKAAKKWWVGGRVEAVFQK